MAMIQVPNAAFGDANDLRARLRMHRQVLNDRGQHLTESKHKIDEELSSIRATAADDIVKVLSADE